MLPRVRTPYPRVRAPFFFSALSRDYTPLILKVEIMTFFLSGPSLTAP